MAFPQRLPDLFATNRRGGAVSSHESAPMVPNRCFASEWAAINEVARLLGVGTAETVRKWVRQAQIDAGSRPGATTEESAEFKRLKRENAELRRAKTILKTASAFFAATHQRRRCCRPHRAGAGAPSREDQVEGVLHGPGAHRLPVADADGRDRRSSQTFIRRGTCSVSY
jgi:transposase